MVKPRFFYGYVIVAATFLIVAASWGMHVGFSIFIEPLSREFGWGSAAISGAWSLNALLNGFLGIIAGRQSDKFGPKKVVLFCSIFFGLGLILMSRIESIWHLYLFYGIITAIGMSAGIAPLQSTVVKWFVKRRGLMVSVFIMGFTCGTTIISPIANQLIISQGWRNAYLILAVASFLVIFFAALLLKSNPSQIGQLPYGATDAAENESNQHQLSGFSLRQSFGTLQFWLLCIYFFCIAFSMMIVMIHIVPHAIHVGISSTTAVTILAVISISAMAATIPEGYMVDKIGIRRTTIILTALLTISMLLLLFLGNSSLALFLFAIPFGVSFSALDILLTLLSSRLFGLIALGAIIGFVNAILQIGSSLGPIVSGIIFDATGSYQLSFLLCTIVSVIALVTTLLLRPTSLSNRQYSR
jgi:MFS family permease